MQIAIDRIADEETRNTVRWIVVRGYGAVVLLAIVRSPAMWLLAPIWISALVAILLVDRVRRLAKIALSATGDLMQVQAENAPPETLDEERPKAALA